MVIVEIELEQVTKMSADASEMAGLELARLTQQGTRLWRGQVQIVAPIYPALIRNDDSGCMSCNAAYAP